MKKIILLLFIICLGTTFAQKFEVGEQVMAFENNDAFWYKATILSKTDVIHYKIHWEGFSSEYDEEVHVEKLWKEGMPYIVNDRLQGLETDGKWYNVKVLKVDETSNKYFIHWEDFADEYDRWISYDSLRLITKENNIEEGKFQSSFGSSGTASATRIGIVYLENKTGQTIKYSFSGDGSSGGGTIYNGQKDNIKNAPIGAELKVNGNTYIVIQRSHDGQTIVINHL